MPPGNRQGELPGRVELQPSCQMAIGQMADLFPDDLSRMAASIDALQERRSG